MRKNRINAFISISDILSAFLLVIFLMLLFYIIQSRIKQETFGKKIINKIYSLVSGLENVKVDTISKKIFIKTTTFEKGSACVRDTNTIKNIAYAIDSVFKITEFRGRELIFFVEGYADAAPIKGRICSCGCFSNNDELSFYRAYNVRNLIIKFLGGKYENKIFFSGYGDKMLLDTINKYSEINRRVEIRFILQ